ncbi:ROK family transcriptional regulator [Tessaracoccus palaemonis]|uniref:ROK family transcriptional regulator n=1 Tax=Tessaracoccus palaemonis TaxID=2829499 RepID=A0ABX8SK12_9ACTN|nr:ROK family transcriptional regulator [Tessaracoccus palaemonis]QXT63712.1 ROK family transcriptional regulator [Tessaracoccus palaemonis]
MTRRLTRAEQRALGQVRFNPGITRNELADELGLSVTTINPLVARLLDAGEVSEVLPTAAERHGLGRPRAALVTTGQRDAIVVVTWGHGVLDRAVATFDRSILWRQRTLVSGHPTREALLDAGREALAAFPGTAESGRPGRAVFGLPVPYEHGVGVGSPAGQAEPGGFAAWFNEDPQSLLSRELGVPVHVENDANLGALGEARHGAAAGEPVAIYVKLSGQGIGCGLTIGGELFSGSRGFAGEIAHMRVDDSSQIICSCGSRGCLEEKIGPNMLRQLQDNYGPTTYADLLIMVEAGTPGPIRLLQDAGRVAGRALADICTFFNPGALVVDAGSPAASQILKRGIQEQIDQSTPPFSRKGLQIQPSGLGEDAAIQGALHIARLAAIESMLGTIK